MKRRHLREDAIRFCEDARARRPDIALGADLIAGFPTETDGHHRANLSLVETCGLVHLHVFPFSPGAGTPAARMPLVDGATIRLRAAELRAHGEVALDRHLRGRVGSVAEVVLHRGHDAQGRRTGLTGDFCRTVVRTDREPGSTVQVRITGVEGRQLLAEPHADT